MDQEIIIGFLIKKELEQRKFQIALFKELNKSPGHL